MKYQYALLAPAVLASAQITEIIDGASSIVSEATDAVGDAATFVTSVGGQAATVSPPNQSPWLHAMLSHA